MSSSQHQLTKRRHIRDFLTKDTCQQLIQSLVMSHLHYANAMLSGIPKTLINIMQNMQNQAARITIGKIKMGNNSATEMRRSLHWLPIKERIDFKIAVHMYKCQNDQTPMYLQKLIAEKKIKHAGLHSSKVKLQLEVPFTKRYTFADRSFSVYMAQNFGILFTTVLKKIKQLTHLRQNLKHICSQKLTTQKNLSSTGKVAFIIPPIPQGTLSNR